MMKMINECTMIGWMMVLCFPQLCLSFLTESRKNWKWKMIDENAQVISRSMLQSFTWIALSSTGFFQTQLFRQQTGEQSAKSQAPMTHRSAWLYRLSDRSAISFPHRSEPNTLEDDQHWRYQQYSFVFHAGKLTSEVCVLQKYVPGKHEWRNYWNTKKMSFYDAFLKEWHYRK